LEYSILSGIVEKMAVKLPENFVHSIDIVCYHKNCADGTGGAWPFWRENYHRYTAGDLIIEGVTHGQLAPEVVDKYVVLVDFCFPRATILKMAAVAKFVVILDHHSSAQRDIEGDQKEKKLPRNVYTIFDVTRSGAQIAWDFVYPGVKCPWFINVIADRDLWQWTLPYSKGVSDVLFKGGYYSWEKFELLLKKSSTQKEEDDLIKQFISMSKTEIETEKEIQAACKRAIMTELTTPNGEKYRVKLATCSPKLRSEVGNRLSEGCDFAVTWQYDFFLDEWWCSARASSGSSVDLSLVTAQFHRGGGHKKAAGFTIKGGENLHTYFETIEIPENRLKDAKLLAAEKASKDEDTDD
jgi:oligoribonuclease NrnB/cAMP/cGMP phosphodiesterase (DHH superfamily)